MYQVLRDTNRRFMAESESRVVIVMDGTRRGQWVLAVCEKDKDGGGRVRTVKTFDRFSEARTVAIFLIQVGDFFWNTVK